MVNQARVAKPVVAKKVVVPTNRAFTMAGLWRLAVWGGTAAAALLVAVFTSHSDVGSLRAAGALSSLTGRRVALVQSDQPAGPATSTTTSSAAAPSAPPAASMPAVAPGSADAQVDPRRLAEAVRNLAADNSQLKTRLAAVENTIGDFTGSVARQVEEAKKAAARAAPAWPDDAPVSPVTSAAIAAMVSPAIPPPDGLSPRPAPPPVAEPQSVAAAPAEARGPAETVRVPYGVDIGSALSIQALRARWAGIRSAHPLLFDKLVPLVSLKENSNAVELRLVAGPVPDADAAARLCTSLAAFHLFCKPAAYGGQTLAP
jgi:hypothetical protein